MTAPVTTESTPTLANATAASIVESEVRGEPQRWLARVASGRGALLTHVAAKRHDLDDAPFGRRVIGAARAWRYMHAGSCVMRRRALGPTLSVPGIAAFDGAARDRARRASRTLTSPVVRRPAAVHDLLNQVAQ